MNNNLKKFAHSVECKAAVLASTVAVAMAGAACAEDATSSTVTTALQTGFTGIKTDAINAIAMIVPIALSIAALVFITKKAISWFKSLAK